ncbi:MULTISPECIES: SDR family NAD(P)-dependent oxidoreductase [Amycolatopsis]|uniref:NAD(P)-dependent dehydrogenase, short-chain alcohol dehydrogenase family n=2 Tax=Amycolatopsis TaxID=1813 RepID=A0A1I4C7A0_9PSEU|nr:SDR family oxidoreductase [Amycolatopsis sacchari]SFK76510.1 NAD(P)-dependent dehydrogenase, short-chain alcohol dehydrogenase family [Amycolatopsis sacchari]
MTQTTALVTGGTSGIGRAIATRLAGEGAHVFVTGRRQAQLDALVAELGDRVTAIRADVSDLDDLDRVYAAIGARGEGLDVLVANAGGGAFATLAELKPEDFDQTFGTNVRGTVFTVQKALPLLTPGASVVVIGSTSAARATPAFGVYSASKAAIRQFSRVWAIELAERGIRVNTLTPGPTDTPGLAGLAPDPGQARALLDGEAGRVPLGRLGQPSEIADAVAFLASPQAKFITGTELFVDGGESQA